VGAGDEEPTSMGEQDGMERMEEGGVDSPELTMIPDESATVSGPGSALEPTLTNAIVRHSN
jgi:hypothetical protein